MTKPTIFGNERQQPDGRRPRLAGTAVLPLKGFYNQLDQMISSYPEYADVLNLIQTDESERVVERPETPLFDNKAFREAIINAVLHNLWVSGNEPMISVFSDRIEILSRGTLPPGTDNGGIFSGRIGSG